MLNLQMVFEHSAVAMCFIKGTTVTGVNNAFLQLFGYSEDEVLGLDIVTDLGYSKDQQISYEYLASPLSAWTIVKRYVKKDSSIFWGKSTVIRNVDELLCMIEDISSFKEIERLYEMLSSDFDTFAYSASHDLIEPLRSIRNYVDSLKKQCLDFNDNQAALDTYAVIIGNLSWVKSLLDGLLSYSRIGTRKLNIKQVSILEITSRCEHALASLIDEKDGQLLVECEAMVRADEIHLQKLLQNLIQNALKYADKPLIKIGCKREGRWQVLWIQDNGVGIDSIYFDFIFKPFKRLSDKPNGIGIGLSECKRIVEMYGGRIWVESEVGKGSTFYFTLPF